ncbi:MAG: hypothetical protein RR376_04830 [Janthinobacterium sp.]
MTDYSKTAARADQSLRRKGGIVVLRQVVTGPYDPDLGTAPITTTDYEGTGVKIAYEAENIDGTLIQAGDQKLLLSPLQRNGAAMPLPVSGDQVLIGIAVYTVGIVADLQPTDTSVLFTLQLRGV